MCCEGEKCCTVVSHMQLGGSLHQMVERVNSGQS